MTDIHSWLRLKLEMNSPHSHRRRLEVPTPFLWALAPGREERRFSVEPIVAAGGGGAADNPTAPRRKDWAPVEVVETR